MMRFLIVLLTFVYTFSATGGIVYLHYCCGEPEGITMERMASGNDCDMCPDHEMPAAGTMHHNTQPNSTFIGATDIYQNCFDVKVPLKKTTETHIASTDKQVSMGYPLELIVFSLMTMLPTPESQAVVFPTDFDTSPPSGIPLFIQHCTYRI